MAKFTRISSIRFKHCSLSADNKELEAAVSAHWCKASEEKKFLFNGTVLQPTDVSISDGNCCVTWNYSDFAHYTYSRVGLPLFGANPVGTIFVSLAITTTDGRIVVGKMSNTTSSPGVVQLPGGGVTSIGKERILCESDLIATAAEESVEELGLTLEPQSLRICGIIEREYPPDIGIVVSVDNHMNWEVVSSAFNRLRYRDIAAGTNSELESIFLVNNLQDIVNFFGADVEVIDYLPCVIETMIRI